MVQNVQKVTRQIMAFPAKVKAAVRAEMARQADEVVRLAKQFVPVDSGDLRDSIGWVWGRKVPKGAIAVGSVGNASTESDEKAHTVITIYVDEKAYYARWVEFGTESHNVQKGGGTKAGKLALTFGVMNKRGRKPIYHPGASAHPFFFPAFRLRKKKIGLAINKAIRTAIKKGF
jgi:HK97 gp10 family phage protein